LPLYIVLLAAFPFVLPAVVRWPWVVIGVSLALYAATCRLNWNLPAYPDGKVWYFNPLAWQVVFHVGAACAVFGTGLSWLDRFRRTLTNLAIAFLLFAAFIALSWHYNPLERLVPTWVARVIYPIDKTNIDILRFLHFLAVAWLVRVAVPIDAPALKWRIWEPLRRCGEASLLIFCIGTFLALSGQVIVSHYEDSILSQIVVSILGIVIMCVAAYIAAWFKRGHARPPARVRDGNGSAPMIRAIAMLVAALFLAPGGAAQAQSMTLCRAKPGLLALGTNLPVARKAIAEKKTLRIIALGSSTTAGYGVSNPAFAYPTQLRIGLEKALPGIDIEGDQPRDWRAGRRGDGPPACRSRCRRTRPRW
jgi:hypothetical protein